MQVYRNKLVSVLITVFNEEKYIVQSLTSLINQSYHHWEAIIIDDSSSDNTINIIKKKFKDRRVKLFKLKKHIGRRRAINYGIKKCKGSYVSILDADDLYLKNKLQEQINYLNKNTDIKLLATWAHLIDEDSSIVGSFKAPIELEKIKKKLLIKNIVCFSSVIFDKSFVIKNNFFPLKLSYAIDYELTLKILKSSKLYILPKFLCKSRIRKMGLTHNKKNQIINFKDNLILMKYVKENFYLNFTNKFFWLNQKFIIYFRILLIKLNLI